MYRSLMTTAPRSSAGRTTVSTCSARSAAYSRASARCDRPALETSSRIERSRLPTGVAPGSRVRTTSWPLARTQSARASAWVDFPSAVAALQRDEEAGAGGRGGGVVAAEQRVPQVLPQRHAGAVVDLGQHQRGDRQQQRADQHEREGGATVREDELAVLQAVRADRRRDDGGDDRAEPHVHAHHGVQVAGDPGPALLLGLLVEQGVRDVGGHARAGAGQREDQQHAGDVRDESGGEQREAREGEGEGEHPPPGERRQQGGRRCGCRRPRLR
ncbi:hypothetical protein SALBM217S_08651 [Streptomyces griseoloalbus]